MRTKDEIQRAHDILRSQILDETPFVFGESCRPQLHAALDVLCWVLRHDHSDGFPTTLRVLERELRARGFVLVDTGRPAE